MFLLSADSGAAGLIDVRF